MRIIVGFQAAAGERESATTRLRVAGLYTEEDDAEEGEEGREGGRRIRRHHVVIQEDPFSGLFDGDEVPKNSKNMGECSLSIIDHGLTRLFYWLGHKIGKNPSYYIIIPIFVSLLCGTGLQRLR
jgi:hypothetical protein